MYCVVRNIYIKTYVVRGCTVFLWWGVEGYLILCSFDCWRKIKKAENALSKRTVTPQRTVVICRNTIVRGCAVFLCDRYAHYLHITLALLYVYGKE